MIIWEILKEVGNAMLDSMENDAHRMSKNKQFSEELRDKYAGMERGIQTLRGKRDAEEDDDDWE